MHLTRKSIPAALAAVLLLILPAAIRAQDKETVLRKLDAAAKNFHSAQAECEFDSVTTEPILDKNTQKGVVFYERKGTSFQMAAHLQEENGKKAPKTYTISAGTVRLYEPKLNQVTVLSKLSQYESWFMLGFGASGKDLEQKWEITYKGSEVLDGKKTEKLELVPKDAGIRKNLPKVTVWMDTETGVNLKQVFDEGPGQYRVAVYFNLKVNQPLPSTAFTLETNKTTTTVSR
ncbi:LolA family protein [Telmatobacter bradus]|uniref:LolA family protein n=1 Tax=Telmatobacter bradus TaxID=474953 RepID=UPI003B431568